jgi:hypothetical protein
LSYPINCKRETCTTGSTGANFANDDALFPHREVHAYYDFSTPDDQEWLVDEILTHKWDKNTLLFKMHWNLSDTTWEPLENCKDLQALDDYLKLIRVVQPQNLPCGNVSHQSHTINMTD